MRYWKGCAKEAVMTYLEAIYYQILPGWRGEGRWRDKRERKKSLCGNI
jgi:hypothetical protein